MPPRIRITEEQIIEGALGIVRENGMSALNARSLAEVLGCSVQPIFRAFTNMEELKEKVFATIAENYQQYLLHAMSTDDRMLGLLMAYVRYAQEEKNFFKLLHMSDRLCLHETKDFTQVGINKQIVDTMAKMTGLSIKDSEILYAGTFYAAHGIASMLATNHCTFTDDTIEKIITDVFEGMVIKLKQDALSSK